ncbi:MAG: arylsulfatase [Burkholderiales bacterium]|nr:arylsulfatase [Burkholderiales bacterium]
MPRIALIHALAHSVAPINAAFERDWPEALRMNLLDDSLSADLARSAAGLDAAMHERFRRLGDYAVDCGADALLFTCSAFGPCIDAVAQRHGRLPVLKPNEAMLAEALNLAGRIGGRIGLVASFAPTLRSMPDEFPPAARLDTELAAGAMDALDRGDVAAHDEAAAAAALRLRERGCSVIALAQFSLARAAEAVRRATGLTVLTTPDSAVAEIRRRLTARRPEGLTA